MLQKLSINPWNLITSWNCHWLQCSMKCDSLASRDVACKFWSLLMTSVTWYAQPFEYHFLGSSNLAGISQSLHRNLWLLKWYFYTPMQPKVSNHWSHIIKNTIEFVAGSGSTVCKKKIYNQFTWKQMYHNSYGHRNRINLCSYYTKYTYSE